MSITIVVLVGRDRENLVRLFDSLRGSTQLPSQLVLVVSREFNPDFVEADFIINGTDIIVIYSFNKKQPAMRNLALNKVSSKYVWFVDDDVSFKTDSIQDAFNTLSASDDVLYSVGCFAGRIIEHSEFSGKITKPIDFNIYRGFVGDFTLDRTSFPMALYEQCKINNKSYPFVLHSQGTSMIFLKKALLEVGGFDEDLGFGYSSFEDTDPCLALRNFGYRTVYLPDVSITHHKLPRIGGVTRGNGDFQYQASFLRNFVLVLGKNSFPNKFLWPFYVFGFSFVHLFRILKGNQEKMNIGKFFLDLFFSLITVLKGVYMGFSLLLRNRTRLNSSVNHEIL